MSTDIETLLEELKAGKSSRTCASLDKLNALLEARFKAGEKDYCIATIGRVSRDQGGVSTTTIRNTTGKYYRRLIEAWATQANTTLKKPPVVHSRQREIPSDNKLLDKLDDPVLRTLFGQIIAERNKYRKENHVLKQQVEVVVDMRPQKTKGTTEVLPALNGVLLPVEIDALKSAISEKFFERQDWSVNPKTGAVKDEFGRTLFQVGFVKAVEKVLEQI